MPLFGRSGGYWLFWTSAVYFVVGMFDVFVYNFAKTEYIQAVWISVVALPLFVSPLARYFNMQTIWEIMFNPFKSKTKAVDELIDEIKNRKPITVELPGSKVEVPKEESPKPPVYEIGKTEDNKVTFTMRHSYGSTTLTMSNSGVDTLIRMLEAAKEPEEQTDEES